MFDIGHSRNHSKPSDFLLTQRNSNVRLYLLHCTNAHRKIYNFIRNNYGEIVPHSNKFQDCKDTNGFDLTLWSLLEKNAISCAKIYNNSFLCNTQVQKKKQIL